MVGKGTLCDCVVGGRVRVLTKLAIRLEVFVYLILLHILGSVQEQAPLYVQGLHPTLLCTRCKSGITDPLPCFVWVEGKGSATPDGRFDLSA